MAKRDRAMLNISFENDEFDYERRCVNSLLEAVLERAVRDAKGNASLRQHDIRDAREWFYSKDMDEFSFLWIAETLQLSSKFIEQIHSHIPQYSLPPSVLPDTVLEVHVSKRRRGLIPSRIPNELRIVYQLGQQQRHLKRKLS